MVHKLIRYGDATLTYGYNGQLLSATTDVRGSLTIQTDYTYSPGKIRAFTHQGKVVLHDETFTLDASGRCTQSLEKGLNGADDNDWRFYYTVKGQLHSCSPYHKSLWVGYDYDADGDVSSILVSNNDPDFKGVRIRFAYDKSTNDKYH